MMNDEIILKSWLELFIMVMTDKKSFKFGQLTMNIEVFRVNDIDKLINFADVTNVKFGLLAKIETKTDFDTFIKTFETNMDDFIPLFDYERLEDVIFTGEARELILKAIGKGKMWINGEWSDQINLL
jgi:hypothetical protein